MKLVLIVGGVANIGISGAVLMGYEPHIFSIAITYACCGLFILVSGIVWE